MVPISDIGSAIQSPRRRDPGIKRFRGTGFMENRAGALHAGNHSALAPENLTTLAHFSVSSAMSLPKSAGDPVSTVAPRSASRAFIVGSARAALISLLSLSMVSAGVFRGAPTPYHELASKSG